MHRRSIFAAALCGTVLLVTGCMAKAPNAQVNNKPSAPATETSIGLVTDHMEAGFNPHSPVDRTLTTDLMATLTLPSVFTPVPAPRSEAATQAVDSTTWTLNTALVTSAEVTSTSPFQVTYRITPGAQWGGSPPVPVEARDFHYLWQVMMRAPNVQTTAGYDLISAIDSTNGGKTVIVTFTRPYTQWRSLFQHLLPSQFLNDIPGLAQLNSTIPYSAGVATVRSVDLERGIITLMPNDKYVTGDRMSVDAIRIQRQSTSDQVAEALRSGAVHAGFVQGDSLTPIRLNTVPGVTARYVWRPRQLTLTVNQASSLLGGQWAISRAVLSLVQVNLVAQLAADRLSGVESGVVPAVAVPRTITVPPQRGSLIPIVGQNLPDTDSALATLTTAGWRPVGHRITTPRGHNRALVIGAVRGDLEGLAAANAVADQLTQVGYPAIVQYTSARELYGSWLPRGLVDLVVGWHSTDQSDIAGVSSRFGCDTTLKPRALPTLLSSSTLDPLASSQAGNDEDKQQLQATIRAARDNNDADPVTGTPLEELQAQLAALPKDDAGAKADKPHSEEVEKGARGANLSGICDPNLSAMITELRETTDGLPPSEQTRVSQALMQRIEDKLWSLGIVLPLLQETVMEAYGSTTSDPHAKTLSTSALGIFYNIARWVGPYVTRETMTS